MKVQISNATDSQIDYLVAKLTNPEWSEDDVRWNTFDYADSGGLEDVPYSPTSDPVQAHAIIHAKGIGTHAYLDRVERGMSWRAVSFDSRATAYGQTLFTAAMRCFLISELGEEAEIPADVFELMTA